MRGMEGIDGIDGMEGMFIDGIFIDGIVGIFICGMWILDIDGIEGNILFTRENGLLFLFLTDSPSESIEWESEGGLDDWLDDWLNVLGVDDVIGLKDITKSDINNRE